MPSSHTHTQYALPVPHYTLSVCLPCKFVVYVCVDSVVLFKIWMNLVTSFNSSSLLLPPFWGTYFVWVLQFDRLNLEVHWSASLKQSTAIPIWYQANPHLAIQIGRYRFTKLWLTTMGVCMCVMRKKSFMKTPSHQNSIWPLALYLSEEVEEGRKNGESPHYNTLQSDDPRLTPHRFFRERYCSLDQK